ncbi:MAG: Ppx/GppA phosphatase family protein [Bacteroidia bacterium]|nr:Ppx/GppA phosphatase family protein [Bacteroidia bacterium]
MTNPMVERIAALDLGTNSFHLLIARIHPQNAMVILEKRRREFVFLGRELEGDPPVFSQRGIQKALNVLQEFIAEGEKQGVSQWIACGTEAFRKAANAEVLLSKLRKSLGLEIRILTGEEEARLIYEGVRHGLPLPEEPFLIMDIGGGSVEFIWGEGETIHHLFSVPLGVTALQRLFAGTDPLSPSEIEAIRRHIKQTLTPHWRTLPQDKITHLIGTSGTFKTLGRLVAYHAGDGTASQTIHGFRFGPMLFYPVLQKLLTLPLSERLALKGMQAERAPLIPYGAILVDEILHYLPIQVITISDYALREGLIYDYVRQHFEVPSLQQAALREQTVRTLAEKYQLPSQHAEYSRLWAERLFDELKPLHGLGSQEREWLGFSAYLHDIGHFINPSGHHKHGLYILLNSPMPGFTSEELLLMANLTRYHRKGLPSSEHFHYSALPRAQKKTIGLLAPLLRLADLLAKYLHHPPQGLEIRWNNHQVEIQITTSESNPQRYLPSIEATTQEFFERSYNRHLVVSFTCQPSLD